MSRPAHTAVERSALPEHGGRRPPRNYFAVGERRRLFRLVMPAGLVLLLVVGWVERTWFPRAGGKGVAQVDTRLETLEGPPARGDEVVIEREPEPLEVEPAARLGASRDALARVRDATFFRESDNDAWFQVWNTVRESGMAGLARGGPQDVVFSELFAQPRSFRGRLVRMKGTLHRVERLRAPVNDYGIVDYWQGWMEPAGGPSSPVVVQCLELPEGMPGGMKIDEPVEIVGYFFKNYAYNASDTIRVAPVVMTLAPTWKPRPAPVRSPWEQGGVSLVVLATLVTVGVAGWLGMQAGRPLPRRDRAAETTGLDAALAGVKLFSVEESLREMARAEGGGASDDTGGRRP